jgi:hypothetical protein
MYNAKRIQFAKLVTGVDRDYSNNSLPTTSVIATAELVILWIEAYLLVF